MDIFEVMDVDIVRYDLKHLWRELNLVGILLYAKELKINALNVNEVYQRGVELGLRFWNGGGMKSTLESIRKHLARLERMGLVLKLPGEQMQGKVSREDRNVKYYYMVSDYGIELMRYIYPYNVLLRQGSQWTPLPYGAAVREICHILGRGLGISLRRMRKISLVGRIGKERFVLKVASRQEVEKDMRKALPQFPLAQKDDICNMLKQRRVSMTPALLEAVLSGFRGRQVVHFSEVLLHLISALQLETKIEKKESSVSRIDAIDWDMMQTKKEAFGYGKVQ